MNIEEAQKFIGKKASVFNENFYMTIKNVKQLQDIILATFEENNFICNIETLKLEDGTKIAKL